jgi:hypothetical protein
MHNLYVLASEILVVFIILSTYLWNCKEANPGHDYEGHCVEPTEKRTGDK